MFAINYWFILLLARISVRSWADWALKMSRLSVSPSSQVNQNRVTDLARLYLVSTIRFLIHTNGRKKSSRLSISVPKSRVDSPIWLDCVWHWLYGVCVFYVVFWCMVFKKNKKIFILMGIKNRVVCHGSEVIQRGCRNKTTALEWAFVHSRKSLSPQCVAVPVF